MDVRFGILKNIRSLVFSSLKLYFYLPIKKYRNIKIKVAYYCILSVFKKQIRHFIVDSKFFPYFNSKFNQDN